MGIREILKKLTEKKDLSNLPEKGFNKIPEDYELEHYREHDRRESVKAMASIERQRRSIMNPNHAALNSYQATRFKGHSLLNQDGNIVPEPNAKTEFNKVVQEGNYTPEEKELYSQNNNPKPIQRGKNTVYKSQKVNIKNLSKAQIRKLGKQLAKARLKQIKARAGIVSRFNRLTQPRGLQKVRPASGIPVDIGKPILNDNSIMKSNVFWSEPQAPVNLTSTTGNIITQDNLFFSNPQQPNKPKGMFWRF